MLQKKARSGKRLFYVTDYPERFRLVGRRFLGKKLSKVERIKV
jgi:hypothetical protein